MTSLIVFAGLDKDVESTVNLIWRECQNRQHTMNAVSNSNRKVLRISLLIIRNAETKLLIASNGSLHQAVYCRSFGIAEGLIVQHGRLILVSASFPGMLIMLSLLAVTSSMSSLDSEEPASIGFCDGIRLVAKHGCFE